MSKIKSMCHHFDIRLKSNIKINSIMDKKKKWFLYSVVSLLIFGLGLSLLGEAIIMKYKNSENWVLLGTLSLVVTNSGLCLFGQAVIEKTKI